MPALTASRPGRLEFTVGLAMCMALTALGIDMALPGFDAMRQDLGLPADSTAIAGVVTVYFIGLAIAQVACGPLADRFGRKPVLYAGLVVYVGAALAATLAPDLVTLLVARFVWGMGAAGPRVVTLSIVRDHHRGEEMARAMSFIMAVFILVPIIAPSLGALVLALATWRWIFAACAVLAAGVLLWSLRLPESLDPQDRLELSFGRVLHAAHLVVTNRSTIGYTLALSVLTGAFFSYLASSQIIYDRVFGAGEQFPLLFGAMAAVMGAGMLSNAFIVRHIGVRRLAHGAIIVYAIAAVAFLVVVAGAGGRPALATFLAGVAIMLSCHAILIPNFNAIAMDPMGEVAGTASAVIGTISTAAGAVIGAVIDSAFDGTTLPFAIGLATFGLLALALVTWAERGRLFAPIATLTPPDPASLTD